LHPTSHLVIPVLWDETELCAWQGPPLHFERVYGDTTVVYPYAVPDSSRTVNLGPHPPHISVMSPYLDPTLIDKATVDRIAEIAAATQIFSYALTRVGRFPGVYYLEPEPASPFIAVTELIRRRWLGCEPYGGVFPDLHPHATFGTGATPPDLLSRLRDQLPIKLKARELWLMERRSGWEVRRFPFRDG